MPVTETYSRATAYAQTCKVVAEMLTENTGTNMIDSGGVGGRAWQRNQGRDFEKEPVVSHSFSAYPDNTGELRLELHATISLYHWMVNALEFDPEMQARLDAFTETQPRTLAWLGVAEKFAESLEEDEDFYVQDTVVFNTYSEPDSCDLSQDIQVVKVESLHGDHLWLVQVHGGADARWGYTAPKAFRETRELSTDSQRINEIYASDSGNVWLIGCESVDPGDNNTCDTDFWDIPVFVVISPSQVTPDDHWRICVIDDRAHLVAPGKTELADELIPAEPCF